MIRFGANTNMVLPNGLPLLFITTLFCYYPIIENLIQNGANLKMRLNGHSISDYMCINREFEGISRIMELENELDSNDEEWNEIKINKEDYQVVEQNFINVQYVLISEIYLNFDLKDAIINSKKLTSDEKVEVLKIKNLC